MLPRILIQVADVANKNRSFGPPFSAIIDTGASTNLISEKLRNPSWKVQSTTVKFKGIAGTLVPSAGKIILIVRPLDPVTKQPIGESKPLEFFLSSTLGDDALLGMPLLTAAQIHCSERLIMFPLGKRTRKVNFIPTGHNLVEAYRTEAIILNLEDQIKDRLDNKMNEPLGVLESIEINPRLPKQARNKLDRIISYNEKCFLTNSNEIPLFRHGDHPPLRLNLSSKIYTQPKHIPVAKMLHSQFQKQLDTWLRQGVCVKQTQVVPYRNNVVPVKKKDGTYRFTIDARNINAIIADENAVVPPIPDILKKACGHKYYTQLDIASFFLCFTLHPDSQDLLTFVNPADNTQYKMVRTPFGCKCVMSNSIILLENELNKLHDRNDWLISYIDDILVYHDDLNQHITDLARLFRLLTKINVKLKPSKVKVAYSDCDLFGYKLSPEGFKISPDRLDSILKIPMPTNRKQLVRVLGQASYFRALLPTDKPMAYFTSHFRDLVSTKAKFTWTEEHTKIWEEFRDALRRNLSLNRLLPTDTDMIVRSDASQSHFGGTLSTRRGDKEILLYTISKAWTPTVSRYHCSRLELIAALLTLYEFRMELIGRKTTLYTDNASVYFVLNNPEKIEVQGTLFPRLFGQIRFINFKCLKTDNTDTNWSLVDALSRATGPLVIARKNVLELLAEEQDLAPDECVKLTELKEVRTAVCQVEISAPLTSLRRFETVRDSIVSEDRYKQEGIVPEEYRNALVKATHLLGHLGIIPMLNILNQHELKWKGRIDDLKQMTKVCTECGVFKPRVGPLLIRQANLKVLKAKNALAIDVGQVGSPAKFSFLVAVDLFTGYMLAIRIPGRATSLNIINSLILILARYAPSCEILRCDNASTFLSWEFKQFCEKLNLKIWHVSRLNSRGNGKVERAIRSIKEQLRFMRLTSYSNSDVDIALELACLAINLKPNHGNISPYTLNYGLMEPRNHNFLPDIENVGLPQYQQTITDRLEFFKNLIKRHFSQEPVPAIKLLKIGDLVRLKVNPQKGQDTLTAPKFTTDIFEIVEIKHNNYTYRVRNVKNDMDIRTTHHRHVKQIITSTDLDKLNKALENPEQPRPPNKRVDPFHMKLRPRNIS